MLSNDTCEKLKGMGLEAFLKGLVEQQLIRTYEDMPFEERFSLLIDFVYQDKLATKLKRLISQAKFRFKEADGNSIIYENRQPTRRRFSGCCPASFSIPLPMSLSRDSPAPGKPFWLAPAERQPAATANVSCIFGWRSCSKKWRLPGKRSEGAPGC